MSDRFRKEYKELSSDTTNHINSIKEKASELESLILKTGETRENSLALTKLEESIFWAVKHLSR